VTVVDFGSSLYLGLRHPSRCLAPWQRLTTGVPAALAEAPAAAALAAGLARLLDRPAAVAARSSLHALLDVVSALGDGSTVWVDAGAYPIAGWAAAAAGRPGRRFAHHDPADLARRIAADRGRPLVLCDGYCPGCGTVAPLDAYLDLAARAGGRVVVDDTQAVGVLGAPAPGAAYGRGGSGTPAWLGIAGAPELITVASLAKGLGAPMAVVAGDAHTVARVRARGPARTHAGPPSAADLAAAAHALRRNDDDGEHRRRRLAASVRRLRAALPSIRLTGGLFPVQSAPVSSAAAGASLAAALLARGIRAVPHRPQCVPDGAAVSLLITAAHRPADIDRAASALATELPAARNGHSGILIGAKT